MLKNIGANFEIEPMFSADHAGKSFFHACKMAEHGGSAPKQGAMCDLEPMFLPSRAVAADFTA